MKLKYYLRGAGTGVITATLILIVAFALAKDNSSDVKALSDQEIIERAEELGMVMVPSYEDEEEPQEDSQEGVATDASGESENKTAKEPANETVNPVTEEEENVVSKVTYKAISVSGGQGSMEVSRSLEKEGLITDADKFNDYIISSGLDNRIQTGTFYVKEGISEEELLVLLVTKQTERISSLSQIPE